VIRVDTTDTMQRRCLYLIYRDSPQADAFERDLEAYGIMDRDSEAGSRSVTLNIDPDDVARIRTLAPIVDKHHIHIQAIMPSGRSIQ
jgi:hypothetical protein